MSICTDSNILTGEKAMRILECMADNAILSTQNGDSHKLAMPPVKSLYGWYKAVKSFPTKDWVINSHCQHLFDNICMSIGAAT